MRTSALVVVAIFVAGAGAAPATAAGDPCLEEAKKEWAKLQKTQKYSQALFLTAKGATELGAANAPKRCGVAYFATKKTYIPATARRSVQTLSRGKCRRLFWAKGGGTKPTTLTRAKSKGADFTKLTKPEKILESYRNAARKEAGTATSAALVAEAVQILGQIVVDRASRTGYRLAMQKVKRWLGCSTTEDSERKLKLEATCRVLSTLRIQELATSRNALLSALLSDLLQTSKLRLKGSTLKDTVSMIARLLPMLTAKSAESRAKAARLIVHELFDEHTNQVCSASTKTPKHIIGLAGLAYLKCAVVAMGETTKTMAKCPVDVYVEQIGQACASSGTKFKADELRGARRLALSFKGAVVAKSGKERLRHAAEAVFDAACLEHKCAMPDHSLKKWDAKHVLAVVREAVLAAIDGDTNQLLVSGLRLFLAALDGKLKANSKVASNKEKKATRKAIRVLGAVVQYAGTLTGEASKEDAEKLHAQRTKILESLTEEMTSRVNRGSDNIFSLGGSLRLSGGARYGIGAGEHTERLAFSGPVSLTLGFAVDLFTDNKGWHIELGVVDLAQYLGFEGTGKVAEPELQYALSPSLTVAYAWGVDFPFFIGIHAGVTPYYQFGAKDDAPDGTKEEDTRAVAFNFGASVGVYVPLLDFN